MNTFFNQTQFGSFIDGHFVKRKQQLTPCSSLTLKEPWKDLALATSSDIEASIKSAQKAATALHFFSAYQRSEALFKIAELIKSSKEDLAHYITMEMGKTKSDAVAEVLYAAGYFEWFAEEAKRISGYTIPSQQLSKQLLVRYEPIGITAVITPWNFPLAMAARKIAPAIAAGCPVIAKPSSTTPLTLLALGAMAQKTALPAGSLNILVGDAEKISSALLASPHVRKLTFTGSCETGRHLYQQCVPTFKKVTLELGGHAPLLVFEDADLDLAVSETIKAKFRLSGQTCICANRILVQQSILPTFLKKLTDAVRQLKVGDPRKEDTDLTNILHPTSIEKIKRHIQDALAKKAKGVMIGKNPYEPSIITDVTPDMLLFREETFGPVVAITSFADEHQALALANDSQYGLASYLFTTNLSRAERVAAALEYGIVGVNDGLPSTPQVPFGGVKDSGFGREGGPKGIYEFLTEKLISTQWTL